MRYESDVIFKATRTSPDSPHPVSWMAQKGARIEYPLGKWVSPAIGWTVRGYGLFAFRTLEDAIYGSHNFDCIYIAEGRGEMPLPEILYRIWVEKNCGDNKYARDKMLGFGSLDCRVWPSGTVNCRWIRLLRKVDRREEKFVPSHMKGLFAEYMQMLKYRDLPKEEKR